MRLKTSTELNLFSFSIIYFFAEYDSSMQTSNNEKEKNNINRQALNHLRLQEQISLHFDQMICLPLQFSTPTTLLFQLDVMC